MRLVSAVLCFVLALGLVLSCTREKSFELPGPATGSLKSDNTYDCLPKTAVGAFIAGTALTDSNYLEVEVNVATAGTYSIRTDTVNGYSFSGIGSFTQTGANRIHLAASGTPSIASVNQFTVIFDTSICSVNVTVLPPGSTSGPAAFTLLGSGDTCMISTVSGNYMQGTQLTADNTVAIAINATTLGTYSITTNTVNGFQFAGAGTIASLGQQTIILTASGTPTATGAAVFPVSAGSTSCNFSINVTASTGLPTANGDLFPLKNTDWWSYLLDITAPNDSFSVNDVGTISLGGNSYENLQLRDGTGAPYDSGYFRKNGTDYYKLYSFDSTTIPGLTTPVTGDVLFLKDNPGVGDSWTTQGDVTINGQAAKVSATYSCTAANTTETINGHQFNSVYKVTGKVQVIAGGVTTDIMTDESHYARGIGLIYQKASGGNTGDYERQIKNWKVN